MLGGEMIVARGCKWKCWINLEATYYIQDFSYHTAG
jgi:hypothetical protein